VQPCRPGRIDRYPVSPLSQRCAAAGVLPYGLVVPGIRECQPGLPPLLQVVAPRIGLAWSLTRGRVPGQGCLVAREGQVVEGASKSFYNPVEQLVLEAVQWSPPFGGSSSNFPLVQYSLQYPGCLRSPNPFKRILPPPTRASCGLGEFRPILLTGQSLTTCVPIAAQYNLVYQAKVQGSRVQVLCGRPA